jgi:hypothetical protein
MGTVESEKLGRYEVYVLSPQLKTGLEVALIDSGSVISLVKESSVTRFKCQDNQVIISGVAGAELEVKGEVDLNIENTLEPLSQKSYVVGSLPRNLDVILGQDWLEKAGYDIQKKIPDTIPTYI